MLSVARDSITTAFRCNRRQATMFSFGLAVVAIAATSHAASRTWDGEGGDGKFSNPVNWSADALPGSPNSTATNSTNADVATFSAAENTTLEIEVEHYRSLGQFRFTGPGDVRLFGLQTTMPIINTDPVETTASLRLNGADMTDTIRVEGGNALIEGDDTTSTASIRFGRYFNNWFVEQSSTLTFDATIGFINTGSTITKTGGGTVVFKGASGNTGGQAAGVTKWTITEGMFRAESPTNWRGNTGNSVNIHNGAALELVNANNGGNNAVMTLNGSGPGGLGVLRASGGGTSSVPASSSAAGAVIPASVLLATDSSIGVETGSTLVIGDDLTDPLNPLTNPAGTTSALTKVGGGTLVLIAASGYHGATVVAEGTLLVNTSRGNVKNVATSAFNGTITTITLDGSQDGTTEGLSIGQTVNGASATSIVSAYNATTAVYVVGDVTSQVGGGGTGTATFDAIENGLYYFDDAQSAKLVSVQSGATLGGSGMIRNTQVNIQSGGFLAPGASVGTFDVGSAEIDGTLQIEFGDNAIDRLVVAGALDLTSAAVDFTALGSLANGEYIFATYDSLVGGNGFASVLNLPGSLMLHHDTTNKYFSLVGSFQAGLPGDFDGDGDVDGADFVVWQTSFPTSSGAGPGDADGDADVDGADFAAWQDSFPAGSSPGTSPVPEPNSFLIVCLSITLVTLFLCLRNNRWQSASKAAQA